MAKLSALGGTMGLLTGFSLISRVEILYHAAQILMGFLMKLKEKKKKVDVVKGIEIKKTIVSLV